MRRNCAAGYKNSGTRSVHSDRALKLRPTSKPVNPWDVNRLSSLCPMKHTLRAQGYSRGVFFGEPLGDRVITESLREKVFEAIERTEHMVSLVPVGRLKWAPQFSANS